MTPHEPVPLLDLKRQYEAIRPGIEAAIQRVVTAQEFVLGPEVEAFEREVAAYLSVKHAVGVANGTDALLLALRAASIGPGDRVITVPFTFFATAGAIANVGATPVFVDVSPDTFNMDPRALEAWVARHPQEMRSVKAILPVHLFGQAADMDPIQAVAKREGWRIIEDAAQAIGAVYNGHKAGALGDLGCFSFYPTKNLGGYGDGGMVVSNDDRLAERVRLLRVHGSPRRYVHELLGTNSRLDALQAAVLRAKLPYLEDWSHRRQRIAARYDALLRGTPGITTPAVSPGRVHVYHQYTIRVAGGRRDALMAELQRRNIGTLVYYPIPLHLQAALAYLGYKPGDFPVSEEASEEVLSIPMFPELRDDEVEAVADAIREFSTHEASLVSQAAPARGATA